ncbi:hypothetical protein Q8W71_05480 [Methylobacterium sp. NEAU 140]|uniref:hypothetical protein n=1 Tax=Methylobacterium sp. NEAU 140 TaxID=3064945 RepID=UPI00273717B0|nr:hypothetical protein [Methylobacterium sp. NEAU 140]MDP4022064.1 hypothetical protein [Methylobacterium sp. NEAU 140]
MADLVKNGPLCRSTIYNMIRDGRLVARKVGRSTVVMAEDWKAMLEGAPVARIGTRQIEASS